VATPAQAVTSGRATSPAENVTTVRDVAAARPDRGYAVRWLLFFDACFGLLAYMLALALREEAGEAGLVQQVVAQPNWSMVLLLGVAFVIFYALGLYEREILALRALHLLTLAKAVLWSAAVGALLMYLLHLPIGFQSRLIVVLTAAFFFLLAAGVRILVLWRILAPRFKADMGASLVVGWPYRTEPLRERLSMLRGYNQVTLVETRDGADVAARVARQLALREGEGRPVFGSLFIDAGSLARTQVLELIRLGTESGANVYVASNRLRPVAPRRLLIDLFEAPVVRVRRAVGSEAKAPVKRLFDLTIAAATLLLLWPLLLVIALAVKLTSKGPILFAQERVGRNGRRFKFYKFRSMYVGNDSSRHAEYVRALINGEAGAQTQWVDGEEESVYKLLDDPRITKVGRVLRRYSLDELPQLLNVVKGDMSLVGPRPPLPYEVDAYRDWHYRRLEVKPGITGVWQVDGRSRVSFDDMVFQDVAYEATRDLLVDTSLCLRTIPAALLSHGGG
jgi:exopolysaccharide biosynthesis polyprenyl glycosylphosphotransferase